MQRCANTRAFNSLELNVHLTSALDAGIKWRPKPSEVTEIGPEFQEYWDSYFSCAPDKPVLRIGMMSAWVFQQLVFQTLEITVVQVHRESYHGTSAQIFHLGCIHGGPICPILLGAIRDSTNTRAHRHTHSRVDMSTSHTPTTSLRL